MRGILKKISKRLGIMVALVLAVVIIGNELGQQAYAAVAETSTTQEESDTSYLLFTSDIHKKSGMLESWLCRLAREGLTNVDYMCFGGDYSSSFSTSYLTKYKEILQKYYPDTTGIYTIGNHEVKGLDTDAFTEITGCAVTGETVSTEDYTIYTLGASSSSQTFSETDVSNLKTFLAGLSEEQCSRPIFIVSHYPLHAYKSRTTKNASSVVEVLNQYPNVIFLWGHNHTKKDPNYSVIKQSGDVIQTSKKENSETTITFTYASLGAMKDGVSQGVYGLVAGVQKNNSDGSVTVSLRYRSLRGYVGEEVDLKYE